MDLKKIIIIIILFLIPFFTFDRVYAWDDCPFGQVNDEYPGDCGRFIDTDKDGICDYSQPAPEDRQADTAGAEQITKNTSTSQDYNFLKISFLTLFLYLLSFSLVKTNKLSIVTHRKIWNIILTIAFVLTAILGLLLVLKVSYGINVNLPFRQLFWHVETGIVFAVVALFHFLWHWSYFKSLLKK
ncbi:hypothetical protein A3J78_01480 [Candidatus Beckwithbacteria bacterium RBG_13_35_6]|uniref:DUF4405 domain-containing protein n=1 Tax=Candidatus Beckwithbacteria bacterium RBG_13_35_6 TaxID=1797456 RepID=A0A1F5DI52_9BACT|nr:MAG: hypothetical protein A3J78_01480 [Candidatus Beckwithbacteria bacterium RBG_13_35_6]